MMSKRGRQAAIEPGTRAGSADPHGALVDNRVHVFVDDQNLFWGIVNSSHGPGFRIDFGRLLSAAGLSDTGQHRFVATAFIAGVIPDDDSFWETAKSQGFTVKRGYLTTGARTRSKQDDAYLITELTATLYEQPGPSTIVLVAGDADYGPPLEHAVKKGWRTEVAFIDKGRAGALDKWVHQYRTIYATSIEHRPTFPR